MKKVILFLIISISLTSLQASEIPSDIVSAFKSGNAQGIARYFNNTIELTIYDKEEIYSKTQAERILKDFFINNPPTEFNLLHQGGKESSKYAIGSLNSGSKTFRVTFLLKSIDSSVFIHQLRIESTNVE